MNYSVINYLQRCSNYLIWSKRDLEDKNLYRTHNPKRQIIYKFEKTRNIFQLVLSLPTCHLVNLSKILYLVIHGCHSAKCIFCRKASHWPNSTISKAHLTFGTEMGDLAYSGVFIQNFSLGSQRHHQTMCDGIK